MTPPVPTDRPHAPRHEEGSVLPFLVVLVGTLLMCAAFVVEFGGTLHAQQRANDLAAQAARTGGQQIALSSAGPTSGSQTLTVDPYAARAAAQAYLTTTGVAGSITVADARITVTVTDTYQSPIVGSITGSKQVTGTATARLVRTLAGTEQGGSS
ncbi:pilus assembly protein TadG-related protein [Promicromonospora sp. NPDC057138]|uniref:pilus assembly protein TadG-related protein n=1 Tax=Promicromonospora sp. NPDC057138 TaxID=3346031 RepID=UPI00363AE3F4